MFISSSVRRKAGWEKKDEPVVGRALGACFVPSAKGTDAMFFKNYISGNLLNLAVFLSPL